MVARDPSLGERESSLIIPLTTVPRPLQRQRRRLDPSSRVGLPAHVTVVYPFAPTPVNDDMVVALSSLCGEIAAFTYELADVGWFDDRVLYLAPRPSEPFVDLTERVVRSFPAYPPYSGAFTTVVPHLTVAEGAPPRTMARAGERLRRRLPFSGVASEVWLMSEGPAGTSWTLEHVFPLRPEGRARDGEVA